MALTGAIRAFFRDRGFLEVETPVRIPCPANEDFVDAEESGPWYLRTSPELHMKRLLAAGCEKLFQLGPCFRSGERGRRHLPEFLMLEWYRAQAGYLDILADTRELLHAAARDLAPFAPPGTVADSAFFARKWEVIPVGEAFRKFAGIGVGEAIAEGRYEEILVAAVEPNLGFESPAVLIDYPLSQAALARRKPGHPDLAERWELYVRGVELANAYGELTDPGEQARRFADSADLRRRDGRTPYPVDPHFIAALEHGLPTCGGIAMGVDRLLMILLGKDTLDELVAFPPEWA